MLLNIIFRCLEILAYFGFAVLKTNLFCHHLSLLLALFCISLKRLYRVFFKPHHIIFTMYIKMTETFSEIDSLQHLKIFN